MDKSAQHYELVLESLAILNRRFRSADDVPAETVAVSAPPTYGTLREQLDGAYATDDISKSGYEALQTKLERQRQAEEPTLIHKVKEDARVPAAVIPVNGEFTETDWSGEIDRRIAAAFAVFDGEVMPVLSDSIVDLLNRQRAEIKTDLQDEVRRLRIELTNLESTLAEVRRVMASERGKLEPERRRELQ